MGRDEPERQRDESKWIVAARPLFNLQSPVAYLSRLQRSLPAGRWKLYFKVSNMTLPPRSSSSSPPTADGFRTGTPIPSPQCQSFSRSNGSILQTSLAYIVPLTRGLPEVHRTPGDVRCSSSLWTLPPVELIPGWAGYLPKKITLLEAPADGSKLPNIVVDRHVLVSAQFSTVTRLLVHPASPVLLTKNGLLGALDSVARIDKAVARRTPKSDKRFACQNRCGPPPEFPLASPRSGIVHHFMGPNRGLGPNLPLRMLLKTIIRTTKLPDSKAGLFPICMPLLRESFATLPWCHGAMAPWCLGDIEPLSHGAFVPWCHGALVPSCHCAMVPRCLATRCHGAMVPWCHGALVHGAMVPWCTVPRCLVAMVPWCLCAMVHWCHSAFVGDGAFVPWRDAQTTFGDGRKNDWIGWGGTNRSDKGMNLIGSWQQGHSFIYNTPSHIYVVCKGFYPTLDGNYTSRRPQRLFCRGGLANNTCPWGPRPLLRVGKRTVGTGVASSSNSDLVVFSHNLAHNSFYAIGFLTKRDEKLYESTFPLILG
ncbi:hypothetical protein FXO38_07895 [Capsicum annuum]|nr:hypothetical protein FXO38_07895 [Capsicum annuum]